MPTMTKHASREHDLTIDEAAEGKPGHIVREVRPEDILGFDPVPDSRGALVCVRHGGRLHITMVDPVGARQLEAYGVGPIDWETYNANSAGAH